MFAHESTRVARVYVLSRVAREIQEHALSAAPDEAMGKLYGYRRTFQGVRYVRVTERATAPCDTGPAHGRFTPEATRACEEWVATRYEGSRDRPREIGVYHSHPFGAEPHLSSTDQETFLSFPYDEPGNVFLLSDPTAGWLKAHVVSDREGERVLEEVPWVEYWAKGTPP
ncbi:MAG: Mov34/MPN/PAD-1 family protein [Planctomycetes bacterium]|nr:Mov34/MPN/PAD-1 family protein [Planctomycetota bacterium]